MTISRRVSRGSKFVEVVRRAFPEYKGRTIRWHEASSVVLSGRLWEGGTKNQYALVNLHTGDVTSIAAPSLSETVSQSTLAIPSGHAVLEHSFFCASDLGVRVYARFEDAIAFETISLETFSFSQ